MTIKEAQELVDALTAKKNIHTNELARMALLTEEIGKLSRVMANRYGGAQGSKISDHEVSEGIGDIFWTLVGIANQTGTDLTLALTEVLDRNMRKKH